MPLQYSSNDSSYTHVIWHCSEDINFFRSKLNLTHYELDICDLRKLEEIYKDFCPEVVVNLAAQAGVRYSIENPMAYIKSNIFGFTNILELSVKYNIKHLVYASTSSVYGANTTMPFSEKHPIGHQVSFYAATKRANELMAHSYSHIHKLPTTGLRFFTVYGPWGRPDMALFLFTKAAIENKPIDVFNHGDMARDFTYIDDIINGIKLVIDNPAQPNIDWSGSSPISSSSSAPYKIYNIGNNNPVKLTDFIDCIEKKVGKKIQRN